MPVPTPISMDVISDVYFSHRPGIPFLAVIVVNGVLAFAGVVSSNREGRALLAAIREALFGLAESIEGEAGL